MLSTTANTEELHDFSAGPTLLDAAKAPYRLGWAFLLAWVFCVFYLQLFGVPSGDALIVAKMMPAPLELFFNAFPVFVSVATLAAVIAAERRVGPPSAHPRFELATAVVAALGTPLLLVSADSIAATTVIFAAASLLTGIGSGVMWVSWGEHYARIPQEEVELFGPVSAVLGALITLGVSAMSGWITVAVVASFPLLSGLCLLIARREDDALTPLGGATRKGASERKAFPIPQDGKPRLGNEAFTFSTLAIPTTMGRTVVGIMAACLFVCVAGALVEGRSTYDSAGVQGALLVSTLFTLAIAFISVVGPRRISISFFYRWMCPALVLGFAAIILFGDALGSYLAFTMSVAARFAFCLITQMYFARVSSEGKMTAVQAYGWGWISVHLGDFLGVLTTTAFAEMIADGTLTLDQVAAASMALLVVLTMFVIDDKRSFASSDVADEDEPALHASIVAEDASSADAHMDAGVLGDADADAPVETLNEQVAAAARAKTASSSPENERRASIAPGAAGSAETAQPGTTKSALDSATSESVSSNTAPNMDPAAAAAATTDRAQSTDERIAAIAREHGLTRRESEVFALLARGRSIPYVRDALVISRETAATHAKHIYAKLGVHSRQELIDLVASGQ